jgi:hypothetical protein
MRTQTRVYAVATALVLATLVLACSDDTTPSPIAPTPPQTPTTPTPAPPGTLYTLSGVVFEVTSAGNMPLQGVEVYCEPCGPPDGHSLQQTGADGVYSFAGAGGVAPGRIRMLLAERGYILPNQPDMSGPDGTGWMGSVTVPVTGDTRYDIQIMQK